MTDIMHPDLSALPTPAAFGLITELPPIGTIVFGRDSLTTYRVAVVVEHQSEAVVVLRGYGWHPGDQFDTPRSLGALTDLYRVEHVEPLQQIVDIADAVAASQLPPPIVEHVDDNAAEHVERVAYIARIAAALALVRGWLAFLTYSPPLLDAALQDHRAALATYAAETVERIERGASSAAVDSFAQLEYNVEQFENRVASIEQRTRALLDDIERAASIASSTLRIGTRVDPESLDDTTRNRVLHYCQHGNNTSDVPTAWEIIAVWQDIERDANDRVRAICRTIRAAATRHHWYADYADALDEIGDDLAMSAWRRTVDVPDVLPLVLDDAPSVHQATAPTRIEHVLQSDVATLRRGVCQTVDNYRADVETMGNHLHEMATGSHSHWCSEYESVVERLNADAGAAWYARYIEPFQSREVDFYVNGTATITLRVPVSTTVTASSESDAEQHADFDLGYHEIADALGVSASDVRQWSWDLDSVDIDDVERAS